MSCTMHLMCLHYPHLRDVWLNHLYPFLLPKMTDSQRKLAIVRHELIDRCQFVIGDLRVKRVLSACQDKRLKASWITRTVVKVYYEPDMFNIVHVSDNGRIHCSYNHPHQNGMWTCIEQDKAVTMESSGERRRWHWEINEFGNGWNPLGANPDLSVVKSVCILRWLLLHEIRSRRVESLDD